MTPMLRRLVWIATVLVVGTGGCYAWLAYALEPASPFDVVNHPWQPMALHAHVLVAPLWLLVAGAAWQAHVLPMLRGRQRNRRRSGFVLLVAMVPMAASGYLLQTAEDEGWRSAWRAVHLVTAATWTIAFAAHVAIPRVASRAAMPARRSTPAATTPSVAGG